MAPISSPKTRIKDICLNLHIPMRLRSKVPITYPDINVRRRKLYSNISLYNLLTSLINKENDTPILRESLIST